MTASKPKKYLWILSTSLPLLGLSGVVLYQWTDQAWMLVMPLLFIYVVIPLMDMLLGEDDSNPSESSVPQLEQQAYYSWVLYLMLPLHFFTLYYVIDFMVSHDLSWWMDAILVFTLGVFGGLAVNLGHELGHKKSRLDKNLAKLALASGAYGHFNIEHNAGHHREVATPEDSASARMGENIYQFAAREIPGGLHRAWKIETQRLARQGKNWYSVDNQILHSYLMTVVIYALMTWVLGPEALFILLLHAPVVWWQLTSANYIEHYGLLRAKQANGKYERCEPWHSWNSNYLVSNLMLFHLQRHSDHHANPARSYQCLRHFDAAPQLPLGYMGMFMLAYVPPLWFRVMDQRLLQLVDGDHQRINAR